jgi:hypothetical protein
MLVQPTWQPPPQQHALPSSVPATAHSTATIPEHEQPLGTIMYNKQSHHKYMSEHRQEAGMEQEEVLRCCFLAAAWY